MIVIGIMTSPYLSGMYTPLNLFAIDQIKLASALISTGSSSHVNSILFTILQILLYVQLSQLYHNNLNKLMLGQP